MKKTGKRTLSLLIAAVMILSLIAVPGWKVQAEELDVNTLPEELRDIDPARIIQYDASYFTDPAGMGSVLVEDADSPLGQAYYHEGLAMYSWLSTAYRNDYGSEKWLTDVHKNDVPIDGQYHFYNYTWAVPADLSADKADIGVYHGGKWIASNEQIAQDVQAYKGQTVDFYVSIKIDGDDASTKCYVDQMLLVLPESGTTEPEPSEPEATEPTAPKGDLLPKELQDVDLKHIKVYDTTHFIADDFGSIVDDPESPLDKAYKANPMPLGAWTEVYRYATDGSQAILLSENHSDAVTPNLNAGYKFYKRTVELPATFAEDAIIYVRHNDEWVCQFRTLADDLKAYAGKTVDFYFSFKVTGTAASCELYIDQMILVDHNCELNEENYVCSVCGKSMVDKSLPEELQKMDASHYKRYTSANFPNDSFGAVVSDSDSLLGSAYKANTTPLGAWTEVYRYATDGSQAILLSENHSDAVTPNLNAGYKFYKRTVELPATFAEDAIIYVRHNDEWVCQFRTLADDLKAYAGKTVDFYFSFKVTGTAESCELYIDQMILVDHNCELNEENYVCSVCGKNMFDETLPEELQKLDTRHYKQYTSADFLDDEFGAVVSDTDSPLGSAYKANAMPLGIWTEVYRYATDGSQAILLSENQDSVVIPNLNAGYKFYKRTVELPATLAEDAIIYVRHDNKWVCQFRTLADDLKAYAGKTVDFYFSFKVTGTAESCELYIDQMILVERCENYWDEGTVTQAPTEEEDGIKTHTCGLCGAAGTEILPKLSPVSSWNLVLDGNIGINFYLNVTAAEAASATVDVSVNGGEPTSMNVADLKAGDKYVLDLELAAAQMADKVTVTLNKGGESYTKNYSVRGYADIILADTEGVYTEEAKNLVKAMLAYGAASQTYFGYNDAEENLADNGIEVTPAAVPTEGGVYSVTGSAEGVKYYGSSLVYRNKIAVRIYFTGDITDKTFTVNGEAVTPETNGDLYYIEVADIYPQDLAGGVTVAVDGLTVTYSPVDYIIRMYAKGGDSAALVQALYGYYLAADAYIA